MKKLSTASRNAVAALSTGSNSLGRSIGATTTTSGVRAGKTQVTSAPQNNETPGVTLISSDERLAEIIGSVAASVGVVVSVVSDRSSAEREWSDAQLVLVGQDSAAAAIAWGLGARDQVYVAGHSPQEVVRWSPLLGASVIVVPQANATLAELLRDGTSQTTRARVVLIGGATGGLGASTLAAGVAGAAVQMGWSSAVVELDPGGGGLDVLLGAERLEGWRWPELASARGVVSGLTDHLPVMDSVLCVSAGRHPCQVGARARSSVVESLAAETDLVVLDRGQLGDDELVGVPIDCRYDIVSAELRGLLAARARSAEADEVLLRRGPGRRMSSHDVAAVLDRDPLLTVRQDERLARAAEQGEAPWVLASRVWQATCRRVVKKVMSRG